MSECWHIIGRGSVGLLWACGLDKLNHTVELILRPSAQQRKSGFTFDTISGEQYQFNVNLDTQDAKASQQPIKYLIVPIKAYDILTAIQQVKSRITPQTVVILCHNGMGTIEQVQQELGPQQPLLFVTTTHGAYRKDKQHVRHTGLGPTRVGWLSSPGQVSASRQQALKYTLDHILPPVSWHTDITRVLWQKLAINCVINPLSAIHQCQNGKLAEVRFKAKIIRLCEEINRVANACRQPIGVAELIDSSYRVIKDTAANWSSMNQDIAARRRSEIDYISGYLIGKARVHGIDVPENQALYRQIKALEAGFGQRTDA